MAGRQNTRRERTHGPLLLAACLAVFSGLLDSAASAQPRSLPTAVIHARQRGISPGIRPPATIVRETVPTPVDAVPVHPAAESEGAGSGLMGNRPALPESISAPSVAGPRPAAGTPAILTGTELELWPPNRKQADPADTAGGIRAEPVAGEPEYLESSPQIIGPLLMPRFEGQIEELPDSTYPETLPPQTFESEPGFTPEPAYPSRPAFTPAPETGGDSAFPPLEEESAGGAARQPAYWIISTRRCPQEGGRRRSTCQFDYFSVRDSGEPEADQPARLKQWLRPDVPVCILVHGSLTAWQDVVRDGRRAWQWVTQSDPTREVQFLVMTWPSYEVFNGLPSLDFESLGRRAAFNGVYLSQLMTALPVETPVCLIGHSHGTRVISSALHLMGGGRVQGYSLPQVWQDRRRVRAVFLASALDKNWLNPGDQYGAALPRAELLVNLVNRTDQALGAYPLIRTFSQAALGERGFTHREAAVLGPLTDRIRQVDVTHLIGRDHVLAAWVTQDEIARAIGPYINFAAKGNPPAVTVTRQLRQVAPPPQQIRAARPVWPPVFHWFSR